MKNFAMDFRPSTTWKAFGYVSGGKVALSFRASCNACFFDVQAHQHGAKPLAEVSTV